MKIDQSSANALTPCKTAIPIDEPTEENSTEIKSYSERVYSCGSDAVGFFSKQLKGFVCGAAVNLGYKAVVSTLGLSNPSSDSDAYLIYDLIFKINPEYQEIYRNSKAPAFASLAMIMTVAQGYSTPGTSANTRVIPKEVVLVNMIALAVIEVSIDWLRCYAVEKGLSFVSREKPQTDNLYKSIFKKAMAYFVIPLCLHQFEQTNELVNEFYVPWRLFEDFGISGLIGSSVLNTYLEAVDFLAMTKSPLVQSNLPGLPGTA